MKIKPMYCCQYCIEAIKSHGEKILIAVNDDLDEEEEKTVCEWCEEEYDTPYDLTPIYFR